LNDTVVILLPPCPLEVTGAARDHPQATIWELLLPEELKRLPAELAQVDAYLDDERFIAPWRALFDRRLGRPSVPVDTLLRLLYLKHRYQLGCESLCREVSDSISWRRFRRIGLDRPVPHPTTLVKLVRRAGPDVIEQLNRALLGKLLRGRKLWADTTVVEADIDYPTDADLLERAVRKLGGLVRRIKARGAASRTRFRDRGRAAGRWRPCGCVPSTAPFLRHPRPQPPPTGRPPARAPWYGSPANPVSEGSATAGRVWQAGDRSVIEVAGFAEGARCERLQPCLRHVAGGSGRATSYISGILVYRWYRATRVGRCWTPLRRSSPSGVLTGLLRGRSTSAPG
jgi:IS5 family transposase